MAGLLVAPRAGGVDRNLHRKYDKELNKVAPRAGGVDRNDKRSAWIDLIQRSPPARGAWIATPNG